MDASFMMRHFILLGSLADSKREARMKRFSFWFLFLMIIALVLPIVWYEIFPEAAKTLPPPGERILVGEGRAVNMIERGEGSPIVLVHGSPGSAYDWAPTFDALVKRGHRVIAYDRGGYGYSDLQGDGVYTIDKSARELLAFLENLGLQDVTLVGWSYGGLTVIAAALEDPSRIARLVLLGSGGYAENPPEPPFGMEAVMGLTLPWVSRVPPASRFFQEAFSQHAFSPDPVPNWWLLQLEANLQRPGTLAAQIGEDATFDWEGPDPAPIDRPILIIHGEEDALVPLSVGEWLQDRSSNSELWIVEDAGHMLPIIYPEPLADRISAFSASR